MQDPHHPKPMQIRKLLIVSPEYWHGDIWGDPDDYDEGNDDPLDSSENPDDYD